MLGRATTAVLTVFKIPAPRTSDYQARSGLACGRPDLVAILMATLAAGPAAAGLRNTCSGGELMPIATPDVYAEMLRRAKDNEYAFPAINCVGSESVNAAIKGFADAGSDGIIQFSTGGAEFASGLGVKDMVTGAVALAEFAHVIAAKYPINVALHTDHCPKDKLDTYVRPLLAISAERVAAGKNPLFQSHMWDGSAVPIVENLEIAQELLKLAAAAKIVLEVEIGVVGGEEDGVEAEINDKLYTTPEDFEKTIDALGHGEHGHYLLAATFGNVHGVYKPGNVKLRPDILDQGQKVASAKLGLADGSKPFDFVFHGGSGSLKSEIEEALRYGVVKMNVDTDTQYAFTRPLAGHMFTNYDGVLKVDGEVGNKKFYDPRSYLKKAEASMTERVIEACNDLHCNGKSLSAS
jgi:fructose-bisphosphate aldolase, class II